MTNSCRVVLRCLPATLFVLTVVLLTLNACHDDRRYSRAEIDDGIGDAGDRDVRPRSADDVPEPDTDLRDADPPDTGPPDADPPDFGPPPDTDPPECTGDGLCPPEPVTLCQIARDRLTSCFDVIDDPSGYGVEWDGDTCQGADLCAARCLAGLDCSALGCSFNGAIDCDSPGPWWYCFDQQCRDDAGTCDGDDDNCFSHYDCCEGRWRCYDRDLDTISCPQNCTPAIPPPPQCACTERGVCGDPTLESVCDEAVRYFDTCHYDREVVAETHPETHARLEAMADGLCDADLACFAGCLTQGEDYCASCHFGPALCERDPFGECLEACDRQQGVGLCEATGGTFVAGCGCCDGALLCGQDPEGRCMDACCGPPHCACPAERPYWSPERGCITAAQCEE